MKLYIAGAGGFGRELYGWAEQSLPLQERGIEFLDDTLPDVEKLGFPRVTQTISDYRRRAEDEFVLVSLGSPAARRCVVELLRSNGAAFYPCMVSSRTVVGREIVLGDGSVVAPHCTLSANIEFGAHAQINIGCSIGHDVRAGDYCTLSPLANLCGNVTLGREVFVGASAVLLPGVIVGDGAVIGAGAVVTRNVEAGQTVAGNPARWLILKGGE